MTNEKRICAWCGKSDGDVTAATFVADKVYSVYIHDNQPDDFCADHLMDFLLWRGKLPDKDFS